MVSADHTEVGERVLQPRQQRREQWGALCNGGNRLAGSAEARRGGAKPLIANSRSHSFMLASPVPGITIGCEIEVLVPRNHVVATAIARTASRDARGLRRVAAVALPAAAATARTRAPPSRPPRRAAAPQGRPQHVGPPQGRWPSQPEPCGGQRDAARGHGRLRATAARYAACRARRAPSGSRGRGDAGRPQRVAARARLCCQQPDCADDRRARES